MRRQEKTSTRKTTGTWQNDKQTTEKEQKKRQKQGDYENGQKKDAAVKETIPKPP